MSLALCRIVLVGTQFPGNVGATARAMRNFGLEELVLVRPECDHLDTSARQMSTHGEPILESARIVSNLPEALEDCILAAATSARVGGLFRRQTVGSARELMPLLSEPLRAAKKTALVFGPERTGLTNEEITCCHHLLRIPTGDDYASLNLAQAVAICLYELHLAFGAGRNVAVDWETAAPHQEQEAMFVQLQAALEQVHFLYGDKAAPLMHALRHLLGKARLTSMEVQVLQGLARQIRWHVAKHTDSTADE
jgi:tRNA/rRNA methyltransferase